MDIEAIRAALEPTRKGLEAAGFGLTLEESSGRLRLTVVAGSAACEDCLVPKQLFRQMAVDEIRDGGLKVVDMDIVYPADTRRQQS